MTLDDQARSSAARKAQDPLLDPSSFSPARLPGLAVVFDQFAASLAQDMAPLCRSTASFALESAETASSFETLARRQGLPVAVLHCPHLDVRVLAIFDRRFVDALAHAIFGGAGDEQNTQRQSAADRLSTRIELQLLEKVAQLSARALTAGFAAFAEADFKLERQETIADTQILGRRDMPVLAAHLAFEASGAKGELLLVLPQAPLLPMRQKLSRDPASDAPAADPRWAKQMKAGVSFAQIPVKGVLEELEMSLGEVADLAVGQLLSLRGAGMGRVRLECGGNHLFWCKLSQAEGRYTLEVEGPIEPEKGLLEGMLSA